jgi:hypothetical protein
MAGGVTSVPADFDESLESLECIGSAARRSAAKDLAGAVGLEPTPSSLTVRCPTNWTTPQQFRDVLLNPTKINIVRKTRKPAPKDFIPGFRWEIPPRSRSASRRPWKCNSCSPSCASYPRRGGTKTTAAVEDQRRGLVGDGRLDVALDDALPEMNGPGQAAVRPFVVFADIHQREFFAGVESPLDFAKIQFLHASFCIIHDGQKSRRMFHENLPECRRVTAAQSNIRKCAVCSGRPCSSALSLAKKSTKADKITSSSTPLK